MPRITITVPDKVAQPYRFSLDRQIVHFGRGDDNDILLDSGSVSSEHAVMERIIGGYVLTDLGSTNGIKLSGEKVKKIHLRNGQLIHIGDVEFGFELSEEEMSSLRKEDPTSHLPPIDEPAAKSAPVEQEPATPTSPEIHLGDDGPAEPEAETGRKPQAKRKAKPQQQAAAHPETTTSQTAGTGLNGLLVVFAVIAFVIGVAMHFQRKTKVSLLDAIQYKLSGGEEVESQGDSDEGS